MVIGIGLFAAGFVALMAAWPVGTALMLFVAGAALLPFFQLRWRLPRLLVVAVALAVAAVTPMWKSLVVHRQVEGAMASVASAAARLRDTAQRDGAWPTAAAGFPDKLEPVHADGYSRDLMLKDCRGESCTLVVTLTDHGYDTSIRGRSFALWTRNGGRTWDCGPTARYPLAPKDLPEACQPTGAY
ncbi:MAG TPA: pilin [Gammaproteobacteria bacterium]|jgi:hypothetical protein